MTADGPVLTDEPDPLDNLPDFLVEVSEAKAKGPAPAPVHLENLSPFDPPANDAPIPAPAPGRIIRRLPPRVRRPTLRMAPAPPPPGAVAPDAPPINP